jgi:arylformamidase
VAQLQSDDIEFQYNPRKAVANVEQYAQRAAQISAQTRSRLSCKLDLRYGAGKLATLDVFPAAQPDAPLHIFLHGGYWRGRDKSDYSYVADALVPLGITTVLMNYDLCPAAELPQIVQQVKDGFGWIHSHAAELGGNPDLITASGHSAGAHLIAAALPSGADARPGPGMPRAAVLVSGIYELEPVLSITVNQEIRLRAEQVDAMSPMRHLPTPAVPLVVAVGGNETAGFVSQSHRFAQACADQGCAATYVEFPRHDHYTVMGLLESPDGRLARLIDGIARPGRGTTSGL